MITCDPPIPRVVADRGVLRAEFDKPAEDCPLCHGRLGSMEPDDLGYEVWKPCARPAAQRRAALFNAASIGSRFADSSFDSYEPKSPAQQHALRTVRDYAQMYPSVQRGLMLWGPVGTGKTHLMVALFRELTLRKGVPCRFIDFGHLLQDLRRSFRSDVRDADLIEPLVDVDVLLIDELGKGLVTDWELGVLDDVVSRRYNAGRTTLATTNFPPRARGGKAPKAAVNPAWQARQDQDMRQAPQTLVDRMNERIYSRLVAMCEFVEVPGADHRREVRTRFS